MTRHDENTGESGCYAAAGDGGGNSDEASRKERVLHTRVPESLDEAIRAAASDLGISVSNLVRNVLANALEVVEAATMRVPARAAAAAASVRAAARGVGEPHVSNATEASTATVVATPAPAAAVDTPAQVLAWQEATLNLNAVCDRCNAIMARGTRAAISIPDRPTAQRVMRCLTCLEELTRDR